MSGKGTTGIGATISIGVAGSPESFVPIAQRTTYAFSGQTVSYDDVSSLDSPIVAGGALEENIPAKYSGGTFKATGAFLPSDTGYTALMSAFNAGTLTDFKVQLPKGNGQTTAGNLYAFSAFISDMPLPDVSFDKAMTVSLTLKINTAITITPGS
jgi:hypothetical protein